MRLAQPHALWLLLFLPLLWWAWRERVLLGIRYPLADVAARQPAALAVRARRALPWLRLAAVLLAVLALARPQYGVEHSEVVRDGISIVMVVDISSSMSAIDVADGEVVDGDTRNRLDSVKLAFRRFVEGRRGEDGISTDVIGMVSFAKYATVLAPLSPDHDALLALLDALDLVDLADEDGTAIGDAIATALDVFAMADEGARVMILLTDGADNAGETLPDVAAEAARALDVRIYTIGAGSRGTAVQRSVSADGTERLRNARTFIDDAGLASVAEATGGRYFRAEDEAGLAQIYDAIGRLEKSAHTVQRVQRYIEAYPLFALLAALALAIEQLLRVTRLRVLTA